MKLHVRTELFTFFLFTAILLITLPYPTIARTIHVPGDYDTIQRAVDMARDNDRVLIHPGRYYENIRIVDKSIEVGSLYLTTEDEAYIDSTIIDGDQVGTVITILNAVDEEAALVGLTITNGYSDGYAGGILLDNSSPLITKCVIKGNRAFRSGGGMVCRNESYPIITYCIIDDNETNIGGGGGIYCEASGPILRYCIISRNHSDVEGGGGIHNHNGMSTLINCTISGNFADGSGGSVWCTGAADFYMVNCIFWNNELFEICLFDNNHITISYSDVEGGQERVLAYQNASARWGEGNIDDDPHFVDAENGDFNLLISSPCIDAGNPVFPNDPDSSRNDMGALYHNQSPVIAVEPEEISFLPFFRDVDTTTTAISNLGVTTLRVRSRTIVAINPPDVNPFFIQNGDEELFLETDSTHLTYITFEPPYAGLFEGEFRVESNDPENREVSVVIYGQSLSAPEENKVLLDAFEIYMIAPNPFNSLTRLEFTLPYSDNVTLKLYDVHGKEVMTLIDDKLSIGTHHTELNGESLPAGLYILRMTGSENTVVKKLMLIK
ncbi:T9SS type A sorting domain-containing protein [bacterium]|nr:T9SS type A sorting domain-containing protein [bacterium]